MTQRVRRKMSSQTKQRISEARRGQRHSEATRRKIREAKQLRDQLVRDGVIPPPKWTAAQRAAQAKRMREKGIAPPPSTHYRKAENRLLARLGKIAEEIEKEGKGVT